MLNFVQRRHTKCRIRHHAITVHCIRSHYALIRPRRLLNYRYWYVEKKNLNKNTHTQNPSEYHIWWPLKVKLCRWSSFLHCMKSSGYLTTIRSHFKKFLLIGWWAQLSVIDRLLSNHYHSEHWLVILSALMPLLICAGPPRRSVSVAPSLVLLQLPVKERNLRFFIPITYSQVVDKSS